MTDVQSAFDPARARDGFTLPWELAAVAEERSGQLPALTGTDRERGERKFGSWRRMVPFRGSPHEVESNMSPFGVGAAELIGLLGESRESLRSRLTAEPAWSRAFTAACEAHRPGATGESGHGLPDDLEFLEISRSLLVDARARLLADLAELADAIAAIPELAALPEILANSLPLRQLASSVRRMCILELNVARVEGRLAGDSPEDRFRSFLRLLRDPEYVAGLWHEYPVLARYQMELLDAWRATRVEFARHLLADFSSLVDVIWDGSRPGALTAVEFGAGDTHRRGRSVAVVRFAEAQVVYKPRALHGDVAFNRCLEWFNGCRPPHRMRVPRLVADSGHGWVEFVERQESADADAFYWRTGALLALLHTVNAADLHLENVIAAGDCPVPVDLEALFHTRLDQANDRAHLADPAAVALESSVTSVGLLPMPWMLRDEDSGEFHPRDTSGIGAAESISSIAPVPVAEGAKTDDMHIVEKHVSVAGAANRPRLPDGRPLDPLAYSDQVLAGFTFAYERIRQDRAEFLRPGGLIDGFADAPLRVILRPTQVYARLGEESMHPDFLRDALDRDRSFARLCQGFDGYPAASRLIAAEIRALRAGDIPVFAVRPGTRDVWLDTGERVADVLPAKPIEVVRDRIQRMGGEDLAFQERVIRDSYTSARLSQRATTDPGVARPVPSRAVPEAELVAYAEEIGQRLLELAVRDGDRIGWTSLRMIDHHYWQVAATGSGLYQGLTGIGMLLTYLAAETGRPLWNDHARLTAHTAAAQLKIVTDAHRNDRGVFPGSVTGFFGELSGLVNFLLHAGQVLGDGEMLTSVQQALPVLEHLLPHDKTYDVIGGNGGLLLTMLAVHEVLPDAGALRIAQSCAEHLIAHRTQTENGHGWLKDSKFQKVPFAGMSHGVAGIALALARLNRVAGDQRWVEAIESALRYENTLYDPDLGNWRDLRILPGKKSESTYAWCHGAPGIGLARFEMLSCGLPEHVCSTLESDLRKALRATWRIMAGPDVFRSTNHSMCHGDLGNVELLTAAPDAGDPPARPEQVIAAIVADGRERGWRCGPPAGSETVGLMPGLAGVGYQLLHLARPSRVPSILRMQPPVVV
jgi:type 2 lantibiotic biosynthesis protein LanM